jgi:ribosome-dependent ATPase
VVRTQIAAIFAIGVLTVLPAVQFSGLLTPVSSLSPWAKVTGLGFPSTYFQQVSVGTFTKALDFGDLSTNIVVLAIFAVGYIAASCLLLRTQET